MTKGIIFDIKRFAVHDGPGIRTTVFLKGCPLSCWWCHNPESRDANPQQTVKHLNVGDKIFERPEITGYETSVDEIVHQVERDRIFYEESRGGVTLSGGEPLYQFQFSLELLRTLKEMGFHTALDTTGYASAEDIFRIMPFTDLFLYDLKLMSEEEHLKYTGVSNKGILDNLKILINEQKDVIIRLPVIPGITDTFSNIQSIIEFLSPFHHLAPSSPASPPFANSPIEVHLLPYHAAGKNKYRRFHLDDQMKPTIAVEKENLYSLRELFIKEGYRTKIGG